MSGSSHSDGSSCLATDLGSSPEELDYDVAKALFLPILQTRVNGKSLFVAGDQNINFDDTLHNTEPQRIGEQLGSDVRIGHEPSLGTD